MTMKQRYQALPGMTPASRPAYQPSPLPGTDRSRASQVRTWLPGWSGSGDGTLVDATEAVETAARSMARGQGPEADVVWDSVSADTRTQDTRPMAGQFLPRGASVGRYIVVERVAQGGMGVVYKAYDPELARQVALKLMRVGRSGRSARARARLVREAQAMAQLSHPNVIAVHDVGTWDEHVFIAMEFVDGQTLRQWSKIRRSIDEIVEVFLAAGRGLAAAHAVGLVHRDFKPDNVIMGSDGRVRVLDFGLARPAAHASPEARMEATSEATSEVSDDAWDSLAAPGATSNAWPEASASEGTSERGFLDSPLTAAGTIAGTPGYMAPEQYLGNATDARVDQFAFCAALYEALHGQRPFPGKTVEEIGHRTLDGRIEPPPADSKVPAWLHALLLRGLAVDPAARHASMAALLAALERGRGRRGQRVRVAAIAAVATIASAMIAGGAIALGERDAVLCQGGEARVAEVWNTEVAASLRTAFLASGRPHAEDTFGRVAAELDGYGQAWTRMHAGACEATHVRGEQSETMLDLRMSCLEQRLGAMRAATRVLGSAGEGMSASAVDRALGAVRQLPGLALCADENALRDAFPLPEDAALRQEIAAVSENLDDAEVRSQIGQFRAVAGELAGLAGRADELGFPPLQARAHFQLGRVRHELGQLDQAEASLRQAAQLAGQARDDRLMAAIWTLLMWLVGDGYGRAEEALRMQPVAEAAIARAGGDRAREADLLAHVGALLSRTGQHARAEPLLGRAIELGRAEWGEEHPAVTRYQSFLGAVYFAQADYARALALQKQLIAVTEAACGQDHLFLVEPMTQIGHILLAQGEYRQALSYFEQSAEVERASLGEDAPRMAQHLLDIATAALAGGDDVRADEALARAWALVERTGEPDHPLVADALLARGRLHLALGDLHQAGSDLGRALSIHERVHGPRHERYAEALWHLAIVDLGQGHGEAALQRFEQVLGIRAAVLPAAHPAVAQALRGIGAARMLLGDHERARTPLERALAVFEQKLGPTSPRVVGALEDLGALALARGRHDVARDFFGRALAIHERLAGDAPPAVHALLGRGLAALALGDTDDAVALLERAWPIVRTPGSERLGLDSALTPLAHSSAALGSALCQATRLHPHRARALVRDVRHLLASHGDHATLRAVKAAMRSCPPREP
jgi:tetratricopeptide (TPR) repeat protein/predicted Ser/Thr protein kinase